MRILFFFSLVICAAHSCPPQYQLMENKCIRPLVLESDFIIKDDLPKAREECAKDGAHLPIIKNDDENALYTNIAHSIPEVQGLNVWIVLDLICNSSTKRLEWTDGIQATYSPHNSVNFDFDCIEKEYTAIDRVANLDWIAEPTTDAHAKTVMCVTEATDDCYDYINMETSNEPCIKIYSTARSWNSASQQCASDFGSLVTINNAEENKYFWRTAISNNFVEGMHIGAHQSGEDPKNWAWIDGEVPLNSNTYSNFIGAFPIPGAGACGAMMTDSSLATWINEDCEIDALPFICRRPVFSGISKVCPTDTPAMGEYFFPPGFPNSDVPCEYVLFAAPNKLVELEISTLIAESNKDFLEIHERPVGNALIANLTGTIVTPTKFTTNSSNVMRVNWNPNGIGSGRGFRIRYHEVDP